MVECFGKENGIHLLCLWLKRHFVIVSKLLDAPERAQLGESDSKHASPVKRANKKSFYVKIEIQEKNELTCFWTANATFRYRINLTCVG